MIVANELRIGNWVEHNANWAYNRPEVLKPFKFEWSERDWYALGECTLSLKDIEPIPLTPEILTERCGFKEASFTRIDGSPIYFIGGVFLNANTSRHFYEDHFLDINNNGQVWIRNSCGIGIIKYLHQLQNLYFALTGEELEIKL